MSTTVKTLSALLVLQVTGAALMALSGPDLSAPMEQRPLLEVSADEIDRVRITDAGEQVVELSRSEDGWMLSDPAFPAGDNQVRSLLDQLTGLQIGQPVATSESALERFRVSPEAFEREIVLEHGDGESVLYAGNSSGAQGGYIRRPDQDAVYSVDFASYEAPADRDNWIDSGLIRIPRDSIAAIRIGEYTLTRTEPAQEGEDEEEASGDGQSAPSQQANWRSETSPEGRSLNAQAAGRLAGQIASLSIDSVLSEEQFANYGQEPSVTFEVERENSETVSYRLFERSGGDGEEEQYAIRSSLREEPLGISTGTANRLTDATDRSNLFPEPDEEGSDQSADSPDQDGGGTNPADA